MLNNMPDSWWEDLLKVVEDIEFDAKLSMKPGLYEVDEDLIHFLRQILRERK